MLLPHQNSEKPVMTAMYIFELSSDISFGAVGTAFPISIEMSEFFSIYANIDVEDWYWFDNNDGTYYPVPMSHLEWIKEL